MAIKRNRGQETTAVKKEAKNSKYERDWYTVKDNVTGEPVDLQDIQNPAYIRVGGSVTKNMGDYNSIRVDVSVELPCAPTSKSVDEAYHAASRKVDDLIVKELENAEG